MHHRLIATSIPYMNGAPHMGHAMEFILADIFSRFSRSRGDDTLFLTGSDEHGSKIYNKAKELGLDTRSMLDSNVEMFKVLERKLEISYDDFIRTTDSERHWTTAQDVWRKIRDSGDIYKKSYQWLYCEGCEAFLQEKDLEGGMCPIHKKPPTVLEEENYFFALSKYAERLKSVIESDEVRITPIFRKNEILSFIQEGLQDVSFSRNAEKMPWGIPVPDDASQVMYVWCDALTNYLSGAGYSSDQDRYARFPETYLHVIGKDISRFHAIIYMAMLMSAGLPLSKNILVHGFVTSNGEKMSKSLGNVVVPDDIFAQYGDEGGAEALRHFVSAGGGWVGEDIDFTYDWFKNFYNSGLVNGLWNVANRISTLYVKNFPSGACTTDFTLSGSVSDRIENAYSTYSEALGVFDTRAAYTQVTALIDWANRHLDDTKPWTIKDDPMALAASLLTCVEYLYHITVLIDPFLPRTAAKMREIFSRVSDADFRFIPDYRITRALNVELVTIPLLFERKQ